jgi:Zn-dependent peptidase ImmA (M78 family)
LVDICNTEWRIIEASRDMMRELSDDEVDGFTDFDTQSIYVNKDLHPYRKAVTLTHELLHVIIDYVNFKSDDEEEFIGRFEHHVYDLVRRFPKEYVIYE